MNLTLNMNKVLDAVIDSDICVNCDKCGSVCPVEAVEEREKNISGLVFASPERVLPSSAGCPLGIVPLRSTLRQEESKTRECISTARIRLQLYVPRCADSIACEATGGA